MNLADNRAQKIVDDVLNTNQFKMQLELDTILIKTLDDLYPKFDLKNWTYYIKLDWSSDTWCYSGKATKLFEEELLRLYPEALI